ncbi:MAG: (2Fe-2S)-binding protein [Ardenticatenaceae bacterium]|nr:(2Fe-2S)-binding protein [Ardenticatenaceae bacterium]HBY93277.1 (2Fe-2S)-binding protein [Chloroflexota bacterium]
MIYAANALLNLRVNSESIETLCSPNETLLETLRERLHLTGTKHGCEVGECGACVVLADGQPVLSCLTLTVAVQHCEIQTIEGVAPPGDLHPLQTAFAESGASQCGYCTPGMVLTAKAFLERTPNPTRGEIREAIAGNICRCTGYVQIVDAVELAAARLREQGEPNRE